MEEPGGQEAHSRAPRARTLLLLPHSGVLTGSWAEAPGTAAREHQGAQGSSQEQPTSASLSLQMVLPQPVWRHFINNHTFLRRSQSQGKTKPQRGDSWNIFQ